VADAARPISRPASYCRHAKLVRNVGDLAKFGGYLLDFNAAALASPFLSSVSPYFSASVSPKKKKRLTLLFAADAPTSRPRHRLGNCLPPVVRALGLFGRALPLFMLPRFGRSGFSRSAGLLPSLFCLALLAAASIGSTLAFGVKSIPTLALTRGCSFFGWRP